MWFLFFFNYLSCFFMWFSSIILQHRVPNFGIVPNENRAQSEVWGTPSPNKECHVPIITWLYLVIIPKYKIMPFFQDPPFRKVVTNYLGGVNELVWVKLSTFYFIQAWVLTKILQYTYKVYTSIGRNHNHHHHHYWYQGMILKCVEPFLHFFCSSDFNSHLTI